MLTTSRRGVQGKRAQWDSSTSRSARNRYFKLSVLRWESNQEKPNVKNETRSGHRVPNVSLPIGRTSLGANRGSPALGSPESKLTCDSAGPARGMQTDRMLDLSRDALAMPQKGSTAELTKANEAMRKCLDGLTSVAELDDFLGQMMAAMTRQLGAVSSTLRIRNFEQNTLPLQFAFQEGRVMAPGEAKYPECWQSVSLEQFDPDFLCHSACKRTKDEQRVATFLDQPAAIIRVLDPHSPMPDDQRSYLRELGVKTVLIIPLASRGQANGRLTFRFTEERDFHPAELEIARALATQTSLAIQLTRLAQAARQTAILEERNQLARKIHDSLEKSFAGIAMQLAVAEEELAGGEDTPLRRVRLAHDLAEFGLVEARRSPLSLRSTVIENPKLL